MGLNVSYNQNINNGVDAASLREVTQKIFQRANSKNTVLTQNDLAKFNRVDLGMDLYSGKVSADTARQVAMANSGMQVNLSSNALASLSFLNAQASIAAVQSAGKAANVESEVQTNATPAFGRLTETADLGQDRKGSNPFYRGELLNVKNEKKDELDLVA